MNNAIYAVGTLLSVLGYNSIEQEKPKQQYQVTANITVKRHVDFEMIKKTGIGKFKQSHFGISGEIPDFKKIDFYEVLERKWKQKLTVKNVKPSVGRSYKKILASYKNSDREYKTLSGLIDEVGADLDKVSKTVRFNSVCRKMRLSDNQCVIFKKNARLVDERVIISYGMTELFPYQDGVKNTVNFNLLLKKAGEKYINSIPAMGDGYLSFGLYQFTSYAAGRDADGARPANMISDLSGYKIPDSVVNFNSKDHHRAAYYFSLYNLALFAKRMSVKQQYIFTKHCYGDKNTLTQFIATAHHQPATAVRGGLKWINDKCKSSYISNQNKALATYAKKTKTNYTAIGNYM